MLEEQQRIRNRVCLLKAQRDGLNIHIADLEKRLLAYELVEGRGNL